MRLLFLVVIAFGPAMAGAQNTVLWKVTGPGLSQPSYLMGTLKFIGEKEYYLPPAVPRLLQQAEVFALEDQVDHHAQHELNKALHFKKDESLAQTAPDVYVQAVAFFAAEFKISKAHFDQHYNRLKPLAITMAMTRLALGEGVRYYDLELLKLAKQYRLKTYSLEPIEREAAALNAYPLPDQVAALRHSLDHFALLKEEFQKLMADYPRGNLEEIFAYTLHPVENHPVFIEEFYFKRNEEWLPKLEKMMKANSAFIAVGVSHLEGERGLLRLLTQRGYLLEPLPVE